MPGRKMGKKVLIPKFTKLSDFEKQTPEVKERGVVALFPILIEVERQDKHDWLQASLVEGKNGSQRSVVQLITFCTSGDAVLLVESEEAANNLVKRSPLYKGGSAVHFEKWDERAKTKLQYRGAYNQIVDFEETEL